MALEDMLNQVNRDGRRSVDTSEANVMRHIDKLRQLISYWRTYPDCLIDFYCSLNPKNSFHLTYSQRIYLRASFRHRYLYGTFTRGFSKSFIAVLSLVLKAILYPGCSLFMTSDVKSQSAGILSEKVSLLCKFIPALENEIIWDTRGANAKTTVSKDVVSYCFKNGSKIENLAAAESSRGKRYNGGIIEECAKIDGKILSSVIIPTMNVERDIWGKIDPDEKLNRSQIYITSAGYKATFAYEKLIQMYCQMVVNPKETFVFGGDYHLSMVDGRLTVETLKDYMADATIDDSDFDREFSSNWSGSVDGSYFDPDRFEKWRTIERPDLKYDNRTKNGYYVMGVDVGRIGLNVGSIKTPLIAGTSSCDEDNQQLSSNVPPKVADAFLKVQRLVRRHVDRKLQAVETGSPAFRR